MNEFSIKFIPVNVKKVNASPYTNRQEEVQQFDINFPKGLDLILRVEEDAKENNLSFDASTCEISLGDPFIKSKTFQWLKVG